MVKIIGKRAKTFTFAIVYDHDLDLHDTISQRMKMSVCVLALNSVFRKYMYRPPLGTILTYSFRLVHVHTFDYTSKPIASITQTFLKKITNKAWPV